MDRANTPRAKGPPHRERLRGYGSHPSLIPGTTEKIIAILTKEHKDRAPYPRLRLESRRGPGSTGQASGAPGGPGRTDVSRRALNLPALPMKEGLRYIEKAARRGLSCMAEPRTSRRPPTETVREDCDSASMRGHVRIETRTRADAR